MRPSVHRTVTPWLPAGLVLAALFVFVPGTIHAAGDLTLNAKGQLSTGHPPTGGQTPPNATPKVAQVDADTIQETLENGYRYQAYGLRDPFVPPAQVRASAKPTKELPVLQQHALSAFKVVGIAWAGRDYYAMVSTEDGKGYTLRVGTKIGPDGGRVRRITKDTVIIEEFQEDAFGETKKYETVLALRPEEVFP